MRKAITLVLFAGLVIGVPVAALADGTAQTLPFSQNWSNSALITVDDDWSGVPGIEGFRGDNETAATGVDPQTLTADVAVTIDVNADEVDPNTFITGGVAEFSTIGNPSVALNGSGTADAPYLRLNLDTTGQSSITLAYDLIDLDGSADNSTQQHAAQYRIGGAGAWTNIAGTYVADASGGPSQSGLTTPISVLLPAACENVALLQIRTLTTNAIGNDEWVAVDNISVTAAPTSNEETTWGNVKGLFQ